MFVLLVVCRYLCYIYYIIFPQDKEGHQAIDFDYKPPEVVPVAGSITPEKEL